MTVTRLRTLIVDDEQPARVRLRALLEDEPDVEIVGESGDGPSAIDAIQRLAPDVVFLDVQMPGLDGFGVIDALDRDRRPGVIFVTAYDRYALQAFEVHAIDYLLKPFDRARLRHALARARALGREPHAFQDRLLELLDALKATRPLQRLTVKSGDRTSIVRVDDVDWIEAAGHYVTLHVGRERHLARETLSALDARLDASRFLRIHRSAIVNLDRITELRASFHGELIVILRDGTRLHCTRTYAARLEAALRQ